MKQELSRSSCPNLSRARFITRPVVALICVAPFTDTPSAAVRETGLEDSECRSRAKIRTAQHFVCHHLPLFSPLTRADEDVILVTNQRSCYASLARWLVRYVFYIVCFVTPSDEYVDSIWSLRGGGSFVHILHGEGYSICENHLSKQGHSFAVEQPGHCHGMKQDVITL